MLKENNKKCGEKASEKHKHNTKRSAHTGTRIPYTDDVTGKEIVFRMKKQNSLNELM